MGKDIVKKRYLKKEATGSSPLAFRKIKLSNPELTPLC
jgi:hypothetical protein